MVVCVDGTVTRWAYDDCRVHWASYKVGIQWPCLLMGQLQGGRMMTAVYIGPVTRLEYNGLVC